jgi:hypothetical protein
MTLYKPSAAAPADVGRKDISMNEPVVQKELEEFRNLLQNKRKMKISDIIRNKRYTTKRS